MRNALILHGAGNDSSGNWFPWLKEQLLKKGYQVWSPDLPNAEQPVLKDWLDVIFNNQDWEFNEESIIIGHSSGATLAMRISERLPDHIVINKTISVAPVVDLGTREDIFPYKEDLVKGGYDYSKIKKSCQQFIYIASDNDPYQCGKDKARIWQEHLGGELVIKKGEGHFNLEQGLHYKQFPLLLKYF